MSKLIVDLGDRSYPIHIGRSILSEPSVLASLVSPHVRGTRAVIVTNPTVGALYTEAVTEGLAGYRVDVFEMEDGEAHKDLATYSQALDFLMAHRHNRTTCLVALGGGVVGDLCGFVAATFQRGVDFVQIPTTLLAQVDSSVGGKTAINHPAGKNMVGAFYQPSCVIADTDTLATLPAREYAAGLAEVVKYGVIVDAEFFGWLEQNADLLNSRDPDALAHAIERSCAIKADVVRQDEREAGVRAILNFGHTFGHAIEALSGYGSWLHGEAVAIGMSMAADLSARLEMLDTGTAERIKQLLAALELPTALAMNSRLEPAAMLDAMGMDKKVVDGNLRFVLAKDMGAVELRDDVPRETVSATLAAFCG